MVGKTISHYRVLEKLGGGGMGVVYKAEDTRLNRTVALKFLPRELTSDTEARKRFMHEAKAASSLDHANICTIHEIDQTDEGQIFICMAYYDGETLKKKIERGPLKIVDAIVITIQIAQGLTKAHDGNIIHRDIKPANIMMTRDGLVKIVDFGLAKLTGQTRLTQNGMALGTASYMSPEQARAEEVGKQTDIWSLGVVLYEMITGELPFKGEYEQSVIYNVLYEEPEPLTAMRTGVPMELEHIVSKLLAKKREERYQHIDEIVTDLQRIQKIRVSSSATKMIRKQTMWQKLLSSPVLWMLIIVAFGLAAGVLLFYPSKTIPFSERDRVLITDFNNQTGENIFNESLSTAFNVSIGQSRYLNVFPRRRVRETLKRMERPDTVRVDELLAQEIAQREGIKIVLVPGISRVGQRYALTTVIEDAKTGAALQSHIAYANRQSDVLTALDELTKEVRHDLGEALKEISHQSKPLVKVTTRSLAALKQYSIAIQKHQHGDIMEAKIYYENAYRIDSTFTAAAASLGMLNYEMAGWLKGFDREKGKKLLAQVVRNVQNLTDRERYGILAFHAQAVENNLQKAAEYQKALLALYPDLSVGHNNLGRVYEAMGHYEDAVAEYKKAIRLDDYFIVPYNSLAVIYLYKSGEVDSALVWTKRQIAKNPDTFWGYDHLGWAYLGLDSLALAKAAFARALAINPRAKAQLYRLAHTLRLMGDYKEAIETLRKIPTFDAKDPWPDYQLGILYQLTGDPKRARKHFERFRQQIEKSLGTDPDDAYNYIALGLVLTRLGQTERGLSLGRKAMLVDSTQHFGFAELLSAQGKIQEALDQLKLAIQSGEKNYIWFKVDPDLQPLYGEPRFRDLMNKVLNR